MTDTATPRNEAAERLAQRVVLACAEKQPIGELLLELRARERQQGREEAVREIEQRVTEQIDNYGSCSYPTLMGILDAIASPSEEPKE